MTRKEIETALDSGKLEIQMKKHQWWVVRRNGSTRTWKRDPGKFHIPVKMGLYGHHIITQGNMDDPELWRIKP